MMQKRQVIQTHIESESENQNTKGRMETKNLPFFLIKDAGGLNLWRRLVLWVKMAATLATHVLVVIFVMA